MGGAAGDGCGDGGDRAPEAAAAAGWADTTVEQDAKRRSQQLERGVDNGLYLVRTVRPAGRALSLRTLLQLRSQ